MYFGGMKIVGISEESPLYGKISPGAELVAVNGHQVADHLDFQFHNTEDIVRLEIIDGGRKREYVIDDPACGDLGLTFEDAKIRVCHNKCIFCFVHQQPKGMRRSLYVKDDDYRFSFTHGNYVSLSGMSEADFARIIAMRLSPLYISVHTTDDDLRPFMFGNRRLEPILPELKRLIDGGIRLHTQAVIVPGVNDGAHLEKTIEDLAELSPGVDSLAVVPVGLTNYRERLPKLRTCTPNEAETIIDLVESYHDEFLDRLGTRFAWPSDEYFLKAGRPIPPFAYSEEMPQFENGVGMVRQFLVDFNRRKRYLPNRIRRPLGLEIVTGQLAGPIIKREIMPHLHKIKNLKSSLTTVNNRFWGKTVTVTGLLTGGDIVKAVKKSHADIILLPPNCINTDELFLDDMSLDGFKSAVGRPVIAGTYQIAGAVRAAIALGER
jgi:putative radical SAM enzyme (TIGR03279 family)